jgi:hypothetical protein
MDSKSLIFVVGFLVVLILIRTIRYFSRKWLKDRPMWVALAFPAVLAVCVFLLLSRFKVDSIAACLQGNTLAACTSQASTANPGQP